MKPVTAGDLRAAAFHTLRPQPSVQAALNDLGFVQADPIRAPARAQDLTLMARVGGYRAGDLERQYPTLDAEEDVIPNYGFMPRRVQALLHPREVPPTRLETEFPGLLDEVRAALREQTEVHPRDLSAALGMQSTRNGWGGQSSATTRALEALHYRGEARVARRVAGVRVYSAAPHLTERRLTPLPDEDRLRATVHLLAALYGPLPEASLGHLVSLSGAGFPHRRVPLRAAFRRAAREELSRADVDGVTYVWPADQPLQGAAPRGVRIVGPFDPLVWDRRRFEHLHGWPYRLEVYTPAHRRQLGYYALPVFLAERAVGWANMRVEGGRLRAEFGFQPGLRQTAALRRGLEAEQRRYAAFLNVSPDMPPG